MDKYLGITYPEKYQNEEAWKRWKDTNCPIGWHLWDEVLSLESHYLFCDACEQESEDLSVGKTLKQWYAL